MAKKGKKNNIKITWVVVIVVAILFFLLLMKFGSLNKATAPVSPSESVTPSVAVFKTYHSDLLDITIDVPSGFTIKEIPGSQEVNLEKEGEAINVHRIGTNRAYKNIEEFLDDINNYNYKPKETNNRHVKINGLDCEVVLTKYINSPEINNKAYNCFINSNVFIKIYTDYESLYPDLDKVASSFRYEP
jgi:hypothetical protein